ncbi:MAG: hypothetical protein WC332_07390 [Clostridia bacterium]|jgi:hypothetical protein
MNEKLFNRYNKVMQKVFEERMDNVNTKQEYFSLIKCARDKFEDELIDGVAVDEILRKDIEHEGIDNVLDFALMICDMYLPFSLISILHEMLGVDGIKSRITDETRPQADRASLVNSLIGYDTDDNRNFLINLITSSDSDLIREEASDVLATFDKDSVFKDISDYFIKNKVEVDLLSVLIEIFRESDKKDQIYKLLRVHFLHTDNKGMTANLMADLNDGRAVSFLRGYLTKNMYSIKKSEIVDICGAISRMGGYVEDFIKYNSNTDS